METTYLTTAQLSERIHYDPKTIRNKLLDVIFIEGIHYIRPFGRRKILYVWETIERDMIAHSIAKAPDMERFDAEPEKPEDE